MAQNGKVNPDCSYAADPDHECTETCLRKIREAPPQKYKRSSGVVPLKFGWTKNRGSKPEPPPVRDSRSEKKKMETNEHVSFEAVSTEKHIQDVMDSEDDMYTSMGCSPPDIIFWLGVLTYLVATLAISFGMSFPSQQHWLLLVVGFLVPLFFIFHVLLYVYACRHHTLTPVPRRFDAGAAATTTSATNATTAIAQAITAAVNACTIA